LGSEKQNELKQNIQVKLPRSAMLEGWDT
jgi:hypothetical protein